MKKYREKKKKMSKKIDEFNFDEMLNICKHCMKQMKWEKTTNMINNGIRSVNALGRGGKTQ